RGKHRALDRVGARPIFKRLRTSTVWEPTLSHRSSKPHPAYCQRKYSARGVAKLDPRPGGRRRQLDEDAARRATGSRPFCPRVAERTTTRAGKCPASALDGGGRGDCRVRLGRNGPGILKKSSAEPTVSRPRA